MAAQTPSASPQFEVASIKPNKSGPGPQRIGFQPGGRFIATNVPVRDLISIAYGQPQPLPNFQIIGGPGWMTSDRFDITAKAEGDPQPGRGGSAHANVSDAARSARRSLQARRARGNARSTGLRASSRPERWKVRSAASSIDGRLRGDARRESRRSAAWSTCARSSAGVRRDDGARTDDERRHAD